MALVWSDLKGGAEGFQRLCAEVLERECGLVETQINGVSGQRQSGVDIVARDPLERLVTVECKFRSHGSIHGLAHEVPDFCHECGDPYPWANRKARIWELQNLLDHEGLDEADRLTVSEQLEALIDPDLSEEEAICRWRRVKSLAPGLVQSGQRVLESVMTAAIKAQLEI